MMHHPEPFRLKTTRGSGPGTVRLQHGAMASASSTLGISPFEEAPAEVTAGEMLRLNRSLRKQEDDALAALVEQVKTRRTVMADHVKAIMLQKKTTEDSGGTFILEGQSKEIIVDYATEQNNAETKSFLEEAFGPLNLLTNLGVAVLSPPTPEDTAKEPTPSKAEPESETPTGRIRTERPKDPNRRMWVSACEIVLKNTTK
jgi:hypothetical protein